MQAEINCQNYDRNFPDLTVVVGWNKVLGLGPLLIQMFTLKSSHFVKNSGKKVMVVLGLLVLILIITFMQISRSN